MDTESRMNLDRLLLRQAMQRSEAPDEVDGVDADDLSVGEKLGELV